MTLNIENIDTLINTLKNEKTAFNMSNFSWNDFLVRAHNKPINLCETPACIAGWSNFLANKNQHLTTEEFMDVDRAAAWLGIDDEAEWNNLFYPYIETDEGSYTTVEWDSISKEQAIDTLERLKTTGKVSWVLNEDQYTIFDDSSEEYYDYDDYDD